MNTKFFLTMIALLATVFIHAAILTVDNNTVLSGSPGQHTSVQAAIDAANNGDTILVVGSKNGYGGVNINKRLTILGPGYNPQSTNNNIATITFVLNNGCSGTVISGFVCSIGNNFTEDISNISIFRNKIFSGFYINSIGDSANQKKASDINIYHNIFFCSITICGNNFFLDVCSNITISNNIFSTGSRIENSNQTSISVKNNLFISYYDQDFPFNKMINTEINNNIFAGYWNLFKGTTIDEINNYTKNCSFNNNLTYNCLPNNNLPYGSNVGSGNIINQDPLFMNETYKGGEYNTNNVFSNNYMIQNSSPCKNAGTDGTDIGPSGGSYPFTTTFPLTGMPAIPIITQMQFNGASSVAVGNNSLNVTVKGKKQN